MIVALSLLFLGQQVQGAFSNYNSILIGEQSAGLGGAYTAMYGDAAGAPFYNPAGLAWMDGNSFSSSVSIYKKFDTLMGKEEDIVRAALRVNQGFFQSIPSSAGSVIRLGDYNIGLSVVVPDYDTYKGDLTTTPTNTSTLSYLDESLWVGGTFAKRISATETAGLTIYYTARNYNRTVQDRTIETDTQKAVLFTEEKNLNGNSVIALLGYQWHASDKWFFGASLRSPSLEVSGSGAYFKNEVTAADQKITISSLSRPSLASHTRIPGKVSLGLAFREDNWLISADASVYAPESYFEFDQQELGAHLQHRLIPNGSLGFEWQAYPWLILRTGGFTNFTSFASLDVNNKNGDHVDQLGWAANLTLISKEKIRFTFGGYYTGGKGRTVQRINQAYSIIPKTQQVFTMLLATSYYF